MEAKSYDIQVYIKKKVKWSRYRPGVAQRVGRGIALFFHDRGTRRWWVVSSTPRPHFTPGKDPVPILQEVGWVPGPVWKGGKSRLHRDSISDRPARNQSLYWLSYPGHIVLSYVTKNDLNDIPRMFHSKFIYQSQFTYELTYNVTENLKSTLFQNL